MCFPASHLLQRLLSVSGVLYPISRFPQDAAKKIANLRVVVNHQYERSSGGSQSLARTFAIRALRAPRREGLRKKSRARSLAGDLHGVVAGHVDRLNLRMRFPDHVVRPVQCR